MNKLQRLKEQIQSLPAKKNRLNLVGVLQRYNVQTSETLEIVNQTRQNAEQVFYGLSELGFTNDGH